MRSHTKILIVNNDDNELERLQDTMLNWGYRCTCTTDSQKALDLISSGHPDLVLVDLMMSEKAGLTVVKEAKKFDPNLVVILLTPPEAVQTAIGAIEKGALYSLVKPYSLQQLEEIIQEAIAHKKCLDGVNGKCNSQNKYRHNDIIGDSHVLRHLFEKVNKIAGCDANVFIYGESGTGKELLARNIHALSLRRSKPFIPVDCVALPEALLESELFGYEKGAFTGAEIARRGLLEYADQGTVFLDEICELAPNLQAKLLRVLQEHEFRRVGGKKLIKVNFRVIAATNKRPLDAVNSGQFREDLYYRLNVIPLELPPLRERKADIPLLLQHYLDKFSKLKQSNIEIAPSAMEALVNYSWPGNIRELKNLVERFVFLLDHDEIRLNDLPDYIVCAEKFVTSSCPTCPLIVDVDVPLFKARKTILQNFEREYVIGLLQKHNGNISKAAKLAKISRRTLYRMINDYNLHELT